MNGEKLVANTMKLAGEGVQVDEIAKRLSVSAARIRRIIERARKRARSEVGHEERG